MSNSGRILLRLLGLVLFVASAVAIVLIVAVGPDEIGREMGKSCRTGKTGPSHHCTWQDALSILQGLPWTCLVGGVLLLVMRPESSEREVDAGGVRVSVASGRLATAGTLAVILVVVASFPVAFVYRAGYTAVETVEVFKEIRDAPRPAIARPSTPAAKPKTEPIADTSPRGLGRGSLLRPDAFRSAMAQVRRAAPAGARLTRLRVSADRIDAEVVGRGRLVSLRKPWNAKATVVSRAAATASDTPIVTFAQLDARAPQRVAVAAARSAGRGPAAVDYLVLMDVAGLRWNAFLADGAGQVTASPDGRHVS